jgi:hypothetical protein
LAAIGGAIDGYGGPGAKQKLIKAFGKLSNKVLGIGIALTIYAILSDTTLPPLAKIAQVMINLFGAFYTGLAVSAIAGTAIPAIVSLTLGILLAFAMAYVFNWLAITVFTASVWRKLNYRSLNA